MNEEAEDLVICPYNKAHVIRKGRLQFHLKKCSEVSDSSNIRICPFNATHHIPKEDFERHQMECKDKKALDMFMYSLKNETQSAGLVPVGAIDVPPSEDNWDDEPALEKSPLETVREAALTKKVLLLAQCVPKSERKAHRMNERLRHQQLSSCSNMSPAYSSFKRPQTGHVEESASGSSQKEESEEGQFDNDETAPNQDTSSPESGVKSLSLSDSDFPLHSSAVPNKNTSVVKSENPSHSAWKSLPQSDSSADSADFPSLKTVLQQAGVYRGPLPVTVPTRGRGIGRGRGYFFRNYKP